MLYKNKDRLQKKLGAMTCLWASKLTPATAKGT